MLRLLVIGLLLFLHTAYGLPSYSGATLTIPIITQDPKNLYGERFSFWYQPSALIWEHTRIYFDGSLGYWWISNRSPNDALNIVAIAPVLRYTIINNPMISPFLDLSIGLAYLSATRIDNRNLGMHFAFQDQLGLGASFGAEKRFSLSLSAMHYSNGSLCAWNAGITIPLLFNINYRF